MIGSIPVSRCSGQLKTQDAFSPPSAVRHSPVSVRTWRATGDSSCTAFSKRASLSFRLADPPCVPSRRSSKWRIRLVIYAGIALSGIAYLPTNKSNLTTRRQQAHPLWTTRNLEPCSQSRCSDPSTLWRSQESGEHVARQRCKRHFQATVAVDYFSLAGTSHVIHFRSKTKIA